MLILTHFFKVKKSINEWIKKIKIHVQFLLFYNHHLNINMHTKHTRTHALTHSVTRDSLHNDFLPMFSIFLITTVCICGMIRLWCGIAFNNRRLLHISHIQNFCLLSLHFNPLFT